MITCSQKLQHQVDEGIDAVIVDSVLKIRNGLTKNAKASEVASSNLPSWLRSDVTLNGVAN